MPVRDVTSQDRSLTRDLRRAVPLLHGDGDECWGLAWPALAWLESELRSGMATLETGAGTSTLVFAAAGTEHESVTPESAEEDRVRAECARRNISSARVNFRIGPSHEVLPKLPYRPLDLVLIDGAHGFPYPLLDWWYLAPRLRVGGQMVLDDCYMPPVAVLLDFLREQASWKIEELLGRRTVVVRKLSDEAPAYVWRGESIGGKLTFRHLPAVRRARAAIEHRILESRLGLRMAAVARKTGVARRLG